MPFAEHRRSASSSDLSGRAEQSDEDKRELMNMKRMRGRNHRPNGVGGGGGGGFRNQQNGIPLNRNHVFDSSGPEMRVRGTAQQLHEKYTQLARDASSSGDRVTGESYYQYAEHYFRIISAINQASGQPAPVQGAQPQEPQQHTGNANFYQPNRQNEYQNRRPAHNQQGNGGFYTEQQESAPEPRPYEPRAPENRPEFAERRPERQPLEVASEQLIDRRIDISSALEAELAAAAGRRNAEPAGLGEQPAAKPAERPAAETREIPIAAAPPEDDAPAPRPRPRGRPRLIRPA
jgi:hypothetical protein